MLAHVLMRQGQFQQAIESTKTVLRESEQRLGPNHGITQDALNTLATAAIRVGDFDTARSSARRIRDAIGPDAAERQRIDEFVNARIAMYSGGAAAAEGPLRKLYLGTPATAAGRSFTALTLAEALLRQNRLDEASAILDSVDRTSGAQLNSRSGRLLVARLLRACLHAKRGELAAANALIAPVVVVLMEDFDDEYYVSLVARAYQALWSDDDPAHRAALASRIERELAWQDGAAAMGRWLRSRPPKANWKDMPIVL